MIDNQGLQGMPAQWWRINNSPGTWTATWPTCRRSDDEQFLPDPAARFMERPSGGRPGEVRSPRPASREGALGSRPEKMCPGYAAPFDVYKGALRACGSPGEGNKGLQVQWSGPEWVHQSKTRETARDGGVPETGEPPPASILRTATRSCEVGLSPGPGKHEHVDQCLANVPSGDEEQLLAKSTC